MNERARRGLRGWPALAMTALVVLALVLAGPLARSAWIEWSLRETDAELAGPVEVPPFSAQALERLCEEDQADRRGPLDRERVRRADARRRVVVRAWLEAGRLEAAPDRYRAALLLQHGRTVEDLALAHRLARAAAEGGYPPARWLCAATEDRWLLAQGRPQRFGTQYQEADGGWELSPVDPATTDAERAAWDVPPLAEARARAAAMGR